MELISSPCLVACGHKRMQSPKSGLSFPAVLIQLPLGTVDRLSLPSDASLYPSDKRLKWRVKADFLRLSRALQNYSRLHQKETIHLMPKKLYAKLCDSAQQKPLVLSDDPDIHMFLASSFSRSQIILNENDGIEDCVTIRREMKRTVRRINQFLQSAHRLFVKERDSVIIKNQYELVGSMHEPINQARLQLVRAWVDFERDEDSCNLEDFSTGTIQPDIAENQNTDHHEKRTAAKLGQYFASESNGRQIVQLSLQLLVSDRFDSELFSINVDLSDVVYIEPSCGDGRIIDYLIDTFQQLQLKQAYLPSIIGYDIDKQIIDKCKRRFLERENRSDSVGSPINYVQFRCCDYLEQSRDLVRLDLQTLFQRRKSDDYSVTDDFQDICLDRKRFVVVGGPPYTTGSGDGASLERKLPVDFILHSAQVLNAESVTFLLPERCERSIPDIHQALNCSSKSRYQWNCQSYTLADDSFFHFMGSLVRQPSVIQCWFRRENVL